jgi:hypothetical protein
MFLNILILIIFSFLSEIKLINIYHHFKFFNNNFINTKKEEEEEKSRNSKQYSSDIWVHNVEIRILLLRYVGFKIQIISTTKNK